MKSGTVRANAVVQFDTAYDAQRSVAGVPAVARIVRELDRAGYRDVWIEVSSRQPIAPEVIHAIHRLAPGMPIHMGPVPETTQAVQFPGSELIFAEAVPDFLAGQPYSFIQLDAPGASAAILRSASKPTDGVVSRWLNRPISRRVSSLLLRIPGIEPVHATIGTGVIAAAMSIALIFGGHPGLVVGALLFHCASVFDGVDGEIARATFRTSRAGAALDSAVDMATNIAAMLGLAINLSLRGKPIALALIVWGLAVFLLGLAMIGHRSLRETGVITFDGVKDRYRGRFQGPVAKRLMAWATIGTSRDFCALVYLLIVLAGIPLFGLYLFAVVTPVWFLFVIAALWTSPPGRPTAEGAM